jgi:transposase
MDRRGATTILLEDWSNPAKDGAPELSEHVEYMVRSFPFAQLRETIEWGAKKRGYTVEVRSTNNNSRDCPSCGHQHDRAQSGTFACEACEFERSADVVFAWNMLRAAGHLAPIREANLAAIQAKKALACQGDHVIEGASVP